MVNKKGKVYLIDFEFSLLDKDNSWIMDLMVVKTINNETRSIRWGTRIYPRYKSLDSVLYRSYMNNFQNILFPTYV